MGFRVPDSAEGLCLSGDSLRCSDRNSCFALFSRASCLSVESSLRSDSCSMNDFFTFVLTSLEEQICGFHCRSNTVRQVVNPKKSLVHHLEKNTSCLALYTLTQSN